MQHTRERDRLKAKAYRERMRQKKQARDSQTDVQIESASCSNGCSQPIRETTPESSITSYDAPTQAVTGPISAANGSARPNPSATGISEQPMGPEEQYAPSSDPVQTRREQTRLRVQRYRERQHRLRLDAATTTSDNLNTVNNNSQDDVLSGLQDLTIDGIPHPKLPIDRPSNASAHDGENRTMESGYEYETEDAHSDLNEGDPSWSYSLDADRASPLSSRVGSPPTEHSHIKICAGLDRFYQASRDQGSETRDRPIDGAIAVYDQLFRLFFSFDCKCSTPPEYDEPCEVHSLAERTQHLQSMLPSMVDIFGKTAAYEPSAHFSKWESFLSQSPVEPLSFKKSQSTLPVASVMVNRSWDIDSIWIGARNLQAIRPPNDFRISFLPSFALNHSREQIIQPHGIDIAKTRHVHFGTFNASSVRFAAFVLFPHAAQGPVSTTSASKNFLSLERQRDFYDQIVMPAVYETIPLPFRQEVPQSYDMVYAKSRSYEEKIGNNRWKRDDQSRAFRLEYKFPARNLARFWDAVVSKANSVTIPTRGGGTAGYFRDPQLFFQAHDLKNTFCQPSLQEVLLQFGDIVLEAFDPHQIDIRSCWLDIGSRDHADEPSRLASTSTGPLTLLWKDRCNHALHERICKLVPESPPDATYYRSFLFRDASTYQSKSKPTRTSNPGNPYSVEPGIIRAKAYNCIKEMFAVMHSDYHIFGSGFLPLLSLSDEMIDDFWTSSHNCQQAPTTQISRSSLLRSWEANKRHLRSILQANILADYGVCKEITFRLETILVMWDRCYFDPEMNPHVGQISRRVSLASDDSEHSPFWILPTQDLKALILTQAARLVLPLDHLFDQALAQQSVETSNTNKGEVSVQLILSLYTAQLLCRLLIHTLNENESIAYDDWIWLNEWVEIARAYNLHLLHKLESIWDRLRAKKGRSHLPPLDILKENMEEVAAQASKKVTAQTIWEIYARGLGNVQFFAPYFVPPKDNLDHSWSAVIGYEELCSTIDPDTMPYEMTAEDFQSTLDSLRRRWYKIMYRQEALDEMDPHDRNGLLKSTLKYLMRAVGPQWENSEGLPYTLPWILSRSNLESQEDKDPFRVPVSASSLRRRNPGKLCRPTIFFPTQENIMWLVDVIKGFPGLESNVLQQLERVEELLDFDNETFGFQSHFLTREQAIAPTTQSASLLWRFLRQSDSPQERICIDEGSEWCNEEPAHLPDDY
ncbi:hypothetical protein FOFC_21063 [Fusarium oxysporum]|nr:hypothetical protein FOFC_21063 [Fusarium oxysporum]